MIGTDGEVTMVIHITRKATGLTETYELTGTTGKLISNEPEQDPVDDALFWDK